MAGVSCRHEADSSWDDSVTDHVIIKHEVHLLFNSVPSKPYIYS